MHFVFYLPNEKEKRIPKGESYLKFIVIPQ